MKKILTASFAVLFALSVCMPLAALAEGDAQADDPNTATDATATASDEVDDAAADEAPAPEIITPEDIQPIEPVPLPDEDATPQPLANMNAPTDQAPADDAPAADEQADCHLTIDYYEIVYYDEEEPNRLRLMGQHVVDGLKPGDVVNVWDYVYNIPGYFFFDGTAPSITISADNSKNMIELMYGKLMNNEFTVNYYLMTGADLGADDWAGALETHPSFYKLGEQKFVNQIFDEEVKGEYFEFDLDGLYAVDTYPESIRVGTNPEDNVLNVLYVPEDAVPPADVVDPSVPDAPGGGSGGGSVPTPGLPNEVVVPTPTDPFQPTPPTNDLPTGIDQMEGVILSDGQVNATAPDEPLEFTEELTSNTIPKEVAERYARAYELGLPLLTPLPVVTNALNIQIGFALMLFLIAFLALCVYAFERGKRSERQGQSTDQR